MTIKDGKLIIELEGCTLEESIETVENWKMSLCENVVTTDCENYRHFIDIVRTLQFDTEFVANKLSKQ